MNVFLMSACACTVLLLSLDLRYSFDVKPAKSAVLSPNEVMNCYSNTECLPLNNSIKSLLFGSESKEIIVSEKLRGK